MAIHEKYKYWVLDLPKKPRFWRCRRAKRQFKDILAACVQLNSCSFRRQRETTEFHFISFYVLERFDDLVAKFPKPYYGSSCIFFWDEPTEKPTIRNRILFRVPDKIKTERGIVEIQGLDITRQVEELNTYLPTESFRRSGRLHITVQYKSPDTIIIPRKIFEIIKEMTTVYKRIVEGKLEDPKNRKQKRLIKWGVKEEQGKRQEEKKGRLGGKFYTNKVRVYGMAHASYEMRFNDEGQEAVVYHFTKTPEFKEVSTAKISMEKNVEGEWRPKLTYRIGPDWYGKWLDFENVSGVQSYLLEHGMRVMEKPKPWEKG